MCFGCAQAAARNAAIITTPLIWGFCFRVYWTGVIVSGIVGTTRAYGKNKSEEMRYLTDRTEALTQEWLCGLLWPFWAPGLLLNYVYRKCLCEQSWSSKIDDELRGIKERQQELAEMQNSACKHYYPSQEIMNTAPTFRN